MKQLLTPKKKIFFMIGIISIIVIAYSSTSFATIFAGGRSSANFNAYYDSSVAIYGYSGAYDSARADWNAASGSVNIGKTTSTSGNPDKYYVGTTATTGLLGVTTPYNSSGGVVGVSDTWAYATVAIYDNQMNDYYMSGPERISNATHEVGHTLSQAHPVTSQSSVMKQGIQSIGVQTWDKESLISKWGN
ncbi:hypothetical protein G5B47_17560 [Paenibacillus sp. 7124]|uniref:Peptidase M10 metallopeptidase domain-containing protein n=1 Tax=Paenibacillus apii TaxID=1850370 RepID=A0A6M1PVN7_9BACL|nr:hypothetical protein [Paenibacillus apii]NGM84221.1 hypothetical protein [Paenibacillus apii]NJJ40883.1 hypothetical protein [Paenibacillus apii]